jgi:hypothetical protein
MPGGENEGFSHYVIENIGSEITIFGLAIMCMKKNRLDVLLVVFMYVFENK